MKRDFHILVPPRGYYFAVISYLAADEATATFNCCHLYRSIGCIWLNLVFVNRHKYMLNRTYSQ